MKDGLGRIQSALILGGTSDIGLAVARALPASGSMRIVLAGRNAEALHRSAQTLDGLRAEVETVIFDAQDFAGHQAFVDSTFDAYGDFDVVVLAFGLLGEQEVAEQDPSAALDILRTNFLGPVSVGIPISQRLMQQGHGSLVVLSSVAGERPRRSNFVYGSSKAGMDAFFQGLAETMRGSGASVVIVRPGFVRTKMTTGRSAAPLAVGPEQVAAEIVTALRKGKEIVWSPAALRWVMMGLRHLPRPIFRRLKL